MILKSAPLKIFTFYFIILNEYAIISAFFKACFFMLAYIQM